MKMFVDAEILSVWVCGALKNRWGHSGYETKGLIKWAGLARFAEMSAP